MNETPCTQQSPVVQQIAAEIIIVVAIAAATVYTYRAVDAASNAVGRKIKAHRSKKTQSKKH